MKASENISPVENRERTVLIGMNSETAWRHFAVAAEWVGSHNNGRSVVQGISLLLATIAIVALLGCEEPPMIGPMGPPGPPAEPPVEQPEDPQQPAEPPEQPSTLPVVSFATSEEVDVWDTAGTVSVLLILSAPAQQPLTIMLSETKEGIYSHPSSISVAQGATSATVQITIYENPRGNTATSVFIRRGSGYTVGEPREFLLDIHNDTRPQIRDPRCPYPTRHPLLDRVSAIGTLCVTGNTGVSRDALDRVSHVSATMLQHRPDLARVLSHLPDSSLPLHWQQHSPLFVVVYGRSDDCSSFPTAYDICGERSYLRSSSQDGYYTCPDPEEGGMRTCVHELAHIVFGGAGRPGHHGAQAVIGRFAEPDVRELWSGYALTNAQEFFAEMSTVYFCMGTADTSPNPHCSEGLREYDPATYEVVHGIYRGSADLREEPGESTEGPQEPEPSPLSIGARISISSTPSGAYITINGDTGNARTPATLELPPGAHDLTVHKAGAGTARGLVVVAKYLMDAKTDMNIYVTLDSTKTDRFPTLREYNGNPVHELFQTIVVDESVIGIRYLPLGREGDPPLTMQFENLPPGMVFEQVVATDTSGFAGPTLIISGTPIGEGTFHGLYKVTDHDGDSFSFPFSFEVVP